TPSPIVLPGAQCGSCDDVPDFDPSTKPGENNAGSWGVGNSVYAPTFNAMIFVYGNMIFNGNIGGTNVITSSGTTPIDSIGGKWRITIMSTGFIDAAGTPAYSPAIQDYPFLFVAGRDIEISGNAGGFTGCAKSPSSPCDTDPASVNANFTVAMYAHEQIRV